MEVCDLIQQKFIPEEELHRVFTESETASVEMDMSFLCFDEIYRNVLEHTDKHTVILDLGCAYAPQCWYFKDYDRYIGVDLPFGNNVRFQTDNAEFHLMSIQRFIREVLPGLGLDLENTVAICSYVPDEEANRMVRETFPRHLVYYIGDPWKTNSVKCECECKRLNLELSWAGEMPSDLDEPDLD